MGRTASCGWRIETCSNGFRRTVASEPEFAPINQDRRRDVFPSRFGAYNAGMSPTDPANPQLEPPTIADRDDAIAKLLGIRNPVSRRGLVLGSFGLAGFSMVSTAAYATA